MHTQPIEHHEYRVPKKVPDSYEQDTRNVAAAAIVLAIAAALFISYLWYAQAHRGAYVPSDDTSMEMNATGTDSGNSGADVNNSGPAAAPVAATPANQ